MNKFLLFLLFVSSQFVFAQSVVINEVMASNKITLLDEDGDASDWIELYNKGTEPCDLSGFWLSDDSTNVKKWQFASVTIQPQSYLLIYASDKNRQTTKLHTNFKISSDGEPIILSDNAGAVIDQIDLPQSFTDISYARISDGNAQWNYQTPSPGLANVGKIIGVSADSVSVSLPEGFYSSAIDVTLSAENSKIFYTLDGSDPDSTSTEYKTPINISSTCILKAISYKAPLAPSPVLYQTYFINEKTDLPVISLSSDPYNLFDASYGIYANFDEDWERPGHIEFFDDNKNLGFSKDCILNIHGSQSAEWAQKSFAVKFKDGIDPLEYKLFPDLDVTKFNSFILRNSGNDWQYTHMRDAMMQSLVEDLDIDYQEYRPATAFINGQYWGIYNIREKISEHYVANKYGIDPDNIDMLENNMEVVHGDSLHYKQLIDYISNNDMSTDAAYQYLDSMIDMDECVLYFAAQAYYDNMDWPGTNIKFWRERSTTGKWRWILYDLDFGFGLYAHNASEDHIQFMFSTVETRYSNPPWATLLQRKLIENSTIKNKFINQIADLLNTNFKTDRVVGIINNMADHIAAELSRHRTRWNLAGESRDKMITFAQQRPAFLRTHVRNYFRCGSDGNLTVDANAGGKVQLNTLQLKSGDFPWSGIYFTSNAVHLTAIPEPGYKFVGWSGAVTSSDATISLNVSRTTNLTANFSKETSDVKQIVINEINYNSNATFDSGDWIELLNPTDEPIDMSNWYYSDSDTTHKFYFPSGTVLQANQYLVIVENDSLFKSRFPDVENYIGETGFGLSGSGEFMKLVDNVGRVVDSLTYDDKSPWPTEADGNGSTLELFDSLSDNAFGENWKASTGNGTPGKINSVVTSVEEKQSKEIPQKFALYQNYPNPFNPSTTIRFAIPKAEYVTLKIYNTLGQEITQLIAQQLNAGVYSVNWNANGCAGGIYYYRITVGTYSETKKLVLLK